MTLFPRASTETEKKSQFEFGKTYTLTSFTQSSTDVLFDTPVPFQVPPEPSRLTALRILEYSESDKKAEFSVEGVAMTKEMTYTLILNETGTNTQTSFDVTFSSTTRGTGSAVLFSGEDGVTELDYNTDYTVTGVKNSSDHDVLFVSGLTFQTKPEPERFLSLSSSLTFSDDMKKTITLSFSSCALLSRTQYTLTLQSQLQGNEQTHVKKLKVTTEENGTISPLSVTLYPFVNEEEKEGQLDFGTGYSLTSFERGDNSAWV
ncbi:hypothetical protein BLNAU_14069 [Blattamonas nauphoetae]|uniref:Uncharacterized protein n=1 Tax=Blattamonas nauphoetae TaxID=2049346 RepID=A0ABQ9XEV0_9EUKA|nr:hypothetical protein BLNAU_14069 [Blattamonas nauphoetae]